MTDTSEQGAHPPEQPQSPPDSPKGKPRQFHGWRLLGVIFVVILLIAIVSAVVDWRIIGPLEGRAPWL